MKNHQRGAVAILAIFTALAVISFASYSIFSKHRNHTPQEALAAGVNPKQPDVIKKPSLRPVSNKITYIDSCRTLSKTGNYVLTGNILNEGSGPCIKVTNVSNVTLDCKDHAITGKNEDYAIHVKGSSNFKIANCKLESNEPLPTNRAQHLLRIENSSKGEMDKDTIGGTYSSISGSSHIAIHDSVFTNQLNVYQSNNVSIKSSQFSNILDPITLQEGYDNSVISNTIDGKSDGRYVGLENSIGADDGIVIKDQIGTVIQGNTLSNFFDCAIENVGYMYDAKIVGNTVRNTGVCFLGGWYYSSVKGILVKDNVVSQTPNLFYFSRLYALKPREKYVYFQNNTFENNKLSDPKLDTAYSLASRIVFNGSDVPISQHILGNNVFKNNDFTKQTAPLRITPGNIVIDGGGNTCSGAEEEQRGGGDPIPFDCH